ncbi:MAG: hypothetical protein D6696_05605 [Acidobacteria bacterium]|nr:MAG: hypothetical protein D6696_05605 [Acidobacteriota bacterium]
MVSRLSYLALVLVVAALRLAELRRARSNAGRLIARGAFEVGREHYPWMVLLHGAFLVACPLEVFLLARPWRPLAGGGALAVLLAAMALRYWVIATLGERWTTRVLLLPGERVVRRGPFRFVRHPNYLAVALEMLALPLVHGAWLSAVVFSLLNALLLRRRIRVEEEALRAHTDYGSAFAGVPLVPGAKR